MPKRSDAAKVGAANVEAANDNEVHLRGRVSNTPDQRTMPSGDRLVSLRLVVPRPQSRDRRSATVDTFDCVAWTARAGDAMLKLGPADHVEIVGALRRRFWRGATGASSRVEVRRVRRVQNPR